ncbi:hypothetical protein C0993_011751 [Termitomyces sp. T159_Od127]|nr:hypothetical protein C0993_011751 [Termitomyces sp. T159_Od127]
MAEQEAVWQWDWALLEAALFQKLGSGAPATPEQHVGSPCAALGGCGPDSLQLACRARHWSGSAGHTADWAPVTMQCNRSQVMAEHGSQHRGEVASTGGPSGIASDPDGNGNVGYEASSDLPEDLEGAKVFVIKLDQGSPGLQVAPVEPDKGARGPVRDRFAAGVGMLDVGFIGNVDFVLEELV